MTTTIRRLGWAVSLNLLTCGAALPQDAPAPVTPEAATPEVECAPDDAACQILKMPQKPGGGGGSGIWDGLRPSEFGIDTRRDLGPDRLPSEQMRLPDARDMLLQKGPVF